MEKQAEEKKEKQVKAEEAKAKEAQEAEAEEEAEEAEEEQAEVEVKETKTSLEERIMAERATEIRPEEIRFDETIAVEEKKYKRPKIESPFYEGRPSYERRREIEYERKTPEIPIETPEVGLITETRGALIAETRGALTPDQLKYEKKKREVFFEPTEEALERKIKKYERIR